MRKFDYFEIVRLPDDARGSPGAAQGVVLGISRNGDGTCSYAVALPNGRTRLCTEAQLASTGRFARPEDIYPGESLRVQVDPHTGRGLPADPLGG